MRRRRSRAGLFRLLQGMASLANLVLLLFTLRRWWFLLAVLRPERSRAVRPISEGKSVLLLAPFRDERENLPALLACLEGLAYPAEKITTVLIDDGSKDGGERFVREWISHHRDAHLIRRPRSEGKAAALNAALAQFEQGELVAVYDADERPGPESLARLVARFERVGVAAASGRRVVSNPLDSPLSSHTALESLVHQLITSRAKERLGLSPPVLGSNCVYRRAALEQVGGFRSDALLEDSDLSVRLVRAGWQTCFAGDAVSYHVAPRTLAGYWRQHTRWTGGFRAVAQSQARPTLAAGQLPWPMKLELLAFSLGYLDRIAWLLSSLWVTGQAVLTKRLPFGSTTLLAVSWLTPLLQVVAALKQAQAPVALWRRVAWLPLMLPLDMFMVAWGFLRGGRSWEERERSSTAA